MNESRRAMMATALALGAAAPLAGSPFATHRGTIDIAELARLVRTRADHIDAIELAEWIRDRRPNLRVIDLRPAEEYAVLHVPTAENVPIEQLISMPFHENEDVVLYSDGGAHAAQAWVFLHAGGHARVRFLAAGIHEWVDEVLEPKLAKDATDRERAAFARASELSLYFGGTPERDVPRAALGARAADLRRRGC